MADLIVQRRDGVQILTINRDHVRNAIDKATAIAIDAALNEADGSADIGATIITGTGERAFCSGMDMKEAAVIGIGNGFVGGRGFAGITQAHRAKPLIAAVNGAALAGGFEIVLACDLVFVADHAQLGISEVKRGLFAWAGGIQRLAHLLPRATALRMILTGEPLPAQRLYDLGVITEVVPAKDLLARALEVTATMLTYPAEAIRNGKLLFDASRDMPLDLALSFGDAFGRATLKSGVGQAGVNAYAKGSRSD